MDRVDAALPTIPDMAFEAAALGSSGFHILPLHTLRGGVCSCGNEKCKSPGKHPIASLVPHGVKDATDNVELIRHWWRVSPDANIGIATGKVSRLIVLDVDGEEGERRLAELVAAKGPLAATAEVKTGRGRHLYFTYPHHALHVPSCAKQGLDVRADGAYVVAPPSIHSTGVRYTWSLDVIEFSCAPEFIVDYACSGGNLTKNSGVSANLIPIADRSTHHRSLVEAALSAPAPPNYSLREAQRTQSALALIEATERETWLNVGMALDWTGWGAEARKIWDAWSRTAPEKFNEQDQESTWRSFDGARPRSFVTLGTIFKLAMDRGWTDDALPVVPRPASNSDHIAFARLAELPAPEYDRVRVKEAEQLGLRVSTLDEEVLKLKPKEKAKLGAGRELTLPEPDPWHEPVAGNLLLDDIAAYIKKHVRLPDSAADAIALWCLHAHCFYKAEISPRLAITSPEKRCGKTTLLRVIEALVPRPLQVAHITAAALFRTVEAKRPTLLIDEADTFLSENEELRGIINSGHARDGQVVRLVGDDHEPHAFSTFCPTVIAAIGSVPGTIEDRSISISLARKRREEPVARFRINKRLGFPDLCRKAARWVQDNAASVSEMDPTVPEELNDRAADNWRSLIAIADQAGGDWPTSARNAALELSSSRAGESDTLRGMMLADIRELFLAKRLEQLKSEMLVGSLNTMIDRPWPNFDRGRPLTAAGLARMLKPYKIYPSTIRFGGETAKGYRVADFRDTFDRYLTS